jgi:hypothetical protein
VASVKQSNVCDGRREAYYFGAMSKCFNHLQHKDYDNNLVKDNPWKEIAGELNAQDKEGTFTKDTALSGLIAG